MDRSFWTRGLAALCVAALAACGGGGDGGSQAGDEAGAAPGGDAPAAAAPAVDPATAATVRGVVNLDGSPPAASPIDMSEEPVCAEKYGADGPMTQEVVSADGRLANVFVYVKEGLSGDWPAPAEPAVLDQDGCRYHPHVVGLQVGQSLLIRNSDAVLHNINTQPTTNRGFNISQPQAGMESTREFPRAEVMIPVKCDVHGWMTAYLGVTDSPFHAVTAADGSFEISGLPPGAYTIEAWHEVYGTQTSQVTVGEAETADVELGYSTEMAGADVPTTEPLVLTHGSGAAASDRAAASAHAGGPAGGR